jgi:hypothetical protein
MPLVNGWYTYILPICPEGEERDNFTFGTNMAMLSELFNFTAQTFSGILT